MFSAPHVNRSTQRSGADDPLDQALQCWSGEQKYTIEAFENPEYRLELCRAAKRPECRDRPPHRRKGSSTRNHRLALLLSVETRQQIATIDRATFVGLRVHKLNRTLPVHASHQGDLSNAQRACAVVPDGNLWVKT